MLYCFGKREQEYYEVVIILLKYLKHYAVQLICAPLLP